MNIVAKTFLAVIVLIICLGVKAQNMPQLEFISTGMDLPAIQHTHPMCGNVGLYLDENDPAAIMLPAVQILNTHSFEVATPELTEEEKMMILHAMLRAPGTPGSTGEQLPVGDATLPLMLMAIAYAGIRYRKIRTNHPIH